MLKFFFGYHFSIEEADFSLCVLYKARIVRNHADRRAFLVQILQQLHHCFAIV